MTRSAGRTSLILGPQDITDLQLAVDVRMHALRKIARSRPGVAETRERLSQLRRRLNDAARRIERGRNGRSEAAA